MLGQSKDNVPPGNRVGLYYSSFIFFYSLYSPLIQTFFASSNSFHLRADCGLCNTTLKPLTTQIQCYSVSIYSTWKQIKTSSCFSSYYQYWWTRLSFSVCSSSLIRPCTHCCPAKNHNNKHILWFSFIEESLWRFVSKFLHRLHSVSLQNNLEIYRSEAEFVVVYVKTVTRDHSNAIF